MFKNSNDFRFVTLNAPQRIWAVSAIHAELDKIVAIHDALIDHIKPGDRIIYLGNYIGYGPAPSETIDELLTFRRLILSMPGMKVEDIVYLRGGQEEMLQKLMQIQFATNPIDVLLWVLSKGLSTTLQSYGVCPHEGVSAAKEGVMALTRWTALIRNQIKKHPGHETFGMQLRRAAYVPEKYGNPVLFVHAGIDPMRALAEQGDSFWWSGQNFNNIETPYKPFQKVVRGYDPNHEGIHLNCVTATIDGGCGFGGELVCAGFDRQGEVFELMQS